MTAREESLLQRRALRGLVLCVTCLCSCVGTGSSATGWKIEFDESGSRPVLVDGVLYLGSADGALYALDANTGATRWRFQTGASLSPDSSGPAVITMSRGSGTPDEMVKRMKTEPIRKVDMTPAVENRTVFVGSGDHSFYAIDAATGRQKWSYPAGPGMASRGRNVTRSAPVLGNGTVYFVTDDGLHALDPLTGKRKWMFETLTEIPVAKRNPGTKSPPSRPVLGDGVVFVTAWTPAPSKEWKKSFLYAVDPESGRPKWVTSVPDSWDITVPEVADGQVFFAVKPPLDSASQLETLYAVDAADGQIAWKVGTRGSSGTSDLRVAGDAVYFRTGEQLLALEREGGRELWSLSADRFDADEILSGLGSDGQHIYVVSHKSSMLWPKSTLYALAPTTGQQKWSQSFREPWASAMRIIGVRDGVVYAHGKKLRAIEAAAGRERWSIDTASGESVRLLSGDKIFLGSPTATYVGMDRVDRGYLYAIDAKTDKH